MSRAAERRRRIAGIIGAIGVLVAGTASHAMAVERMCAKTVESTVADYASQLGGGIVRLIITIRIADGETRSGIDAKTRALADELKRAGAAMADPIAGQPLIVAELRRQQLLPLGRDPRIQCIARDTPDAPG